jgi:hypothetical protein
MHNPLRSVVCWLLACSSLWLSFNSDGTAAEPKLAIATFNVDATPPLGSPLCDGLVVPAKEVVDPLSARGIVLLGSGAPIVLCAVDWVGIGNGGYDAWREALAKAVGTTPDRVAVHTLHQHDAPGCDFEAEALLAAQGLSGSMFHVVFARQTIERVAAAAKAAIQQAQPVTHVGVGQAKVERVASNRRVLGPNGKVKYVRYSATKIPEAIAAPEGTIDPQVRLLSFWDGDRPLASLTYYTTHPQSYYGQGGVSADFPGLARALREKALPALAHIHFNGASGNVTAGKYNDGAVANRARLAERLAAGMKAAWDATNKHPVAAGDVHWRTTDVVLPLSPRLLDEGPLVADLENSQQQLRLRIRAARDLTFARRTQAGHKTQLACLQIGPAYVLHMPGELFVEYELAAINRKPGNLVCMAAYGDYGAGYIGTEIAYTQGGYETGVVSRVAPQVESVLMQAIDKLLP